MKAYIAKPFVFLGCVGALLTLLGFLGHWHLMFDLISNFKVQYLVGVLLVIAVALWCRLYLALAVLALVLLVHGMGVVGLYIPESSELRESSVSLRVMTSNLQAGNTAYQDHLTTVGRVDPDVIVFQEYTLGWHAELDNKLDQYPYRFTRAIDSPFGIAIYSKFSFLSEEMIVVNASATAILEVSIEFDGQPMRILGTHPVPPIGTGLFRQRNSQLRDMAKRVKKFEEPTVMLGDLNVTPWSVFFNDLVRESGLRDARQGFGLHPTWPTWFFPAGIPIDHILISETLAVLEVQTAASQGSDHKSLWADVIVR